MVVLDDGRYGQVRFKSAGRGRIRIISILVSDTDDESDKDAWTVLPLRKIDKGELRYLISQLDLSELDLDF